MGQLSLTQLKQSSRFYPKFVIRTPARPYDLQVSPVDAEVLRSFAADPVAQEAIFLSSPKFYEALIASNSNSNSFNVDPNRFQLALLKYYRRIHNRCTPFGTFSACGVGDWSEKTIISLNNFTRHTSFDSDKAAQVLRSLSGKLENQLHLIFFATPNYYLTGDRIRYFKYTLEKGRRKYSIRSIEYSELLIKILKFSKTGLKFHSIEQIVTEQGYDVHSARRFVSELIHEQLLISEIEPRPYANFIADLKNVTQRIGNDKALGFLSNVEDVESILTSFDKSNYGNISAYSDLSNLLFVDLKSNDECAYHVNSFWKESNIKLQIGIQDNLIRTIHFLDKIIPKAAVHRLQDFKLKFHRKYEYSAVPLLRALDPDIGIGYGESDNNYSWLLDEIRFSKRDMSKDISLTSTSKVLLTKLIQAQTLDQCEIKLEDSDFASVDFSSNNYGASMFLKFEVLSSNGKLRFDYAGGSSAINMIARFANGNVEIEKIARDIANHEKQYYAPAIVAEIVHVTEDKVINVLGNVNIRETQLLFEQPRNQSKAVNLQNLWLKMVDGKLVVYDAESGDEIIPKLSNAHHYREDHAPAYQFLCDLQFQDNDKQFIAFSWCGANQFFSYTPRVIYNNVIIEPATWNIKKADYLQLLNNSEVDLEKSINDWRATLKLPEAICYKSGDNILSLNLAEHLDRKLLLSLLKQSPGVCLTETISPEKSLVQDKLGRNYSNECIAFLLLDRKQVVKGNHAAFHSKNNIVETTNFLPGEEWLYFQVFMSRFNVNRLLYFLNEKIFSVLLHSNSLEKWFFVRYDEPEHHLRIRMKLSNTIHFEPTLKSVMQFLADSANTGTINSFSIETYHRETSRYGSSMELVEQIFHAESEIAVRLLNSNSRKYEIVSYSIQAILDLLQSLNFSTYEQLQLCKSQYQMLMAEFGQERSLYREINKFISSHTKELFRFVPGEGLMVKLSETTLKLLEGKARLFSSPCSKILGLFDTGRMETTKGHLITSIIHMMINRLFGVRPRHSELIIYYLTARVLESQVAIYKAPNESYD